MKGLHLNPAQRAKWLEIAFEVLGALAGLIVATATLIIIRVRW